MKGSFATEIPCALGRRLVGSLHRHRAWRVGFALLLATPGWSQTIDPASSTTPNNPTAIPVSEFAAGHGSVSVDYQHLFENGDWWDVGPKRPQGSVIFNSVKLDLDYFVADRWDINVALPFIQARYSGNFPHPVATLQVPHPNTVFVDDGSWHGTWADWGTGLSYHANIGSYYLTPSITAYVPSHDYTFYGAATVGQDLRKLGVGIELGHQFAFSNFYYDAYYQYVFVERALDINANYSDFGMNVGYFARPSLQVRGFVDGKLGNGITDTQVAAHCPPCADEYWYLHDKHQLEEYVNVGGALDYQLDDHYTFTAAVQRMVWGDSIINMKYGIDFKLARSF